MQLNRVAYTDSFRCLVGLSTDERVWHKKVSLLTGVRLQPSSAMNKW